MLYCLICSLHQLFLEGGDIELFLSSSDALEERQRAFFFNLGFLAEGTGLDCFVLALATFSFHALLAAQAWHKTLHAEIIFRFAAGLITAVI